MTYYHTYNSGVKRFGPHCSLISRLVVTKGSDDERTSPVIAITRHITICSGNFTDLAEI